jgi:hypothetical protein
MNEYEAVDETRTDMGKHVFGETPLPTRLSYGYSPVYGAERIFRPKTGSTTRMRTYMR